MSDYSSDLDELDERMRTSPLLRALDELSEAMGEAYQICTEHRPIRDTHEGREATLRTIREEILEGRPLRSFKAEHLAFLETLIAYWRELEVECGRPALAPEPDPLQ